MFLTVNQSTPSRRVSRDADLLAEEVSDFLAFALPGVLRVGEPCRTPEKFSLSRQSVAANRDDDRPGEPGVMRPCKAGKNGFDP